MPPSLKVVNREVGFLLRVTDPNGKKGSTFSVVQHYNGGL